MNRSVPSKARTLKKYCVILAAFNGVRFLHEQIDSILQQQGVEVRLVISVDRSTDGTEVLAKSIAQKDARVSILPFCNTFGGAAPNFFHLLRCIEIQDFDYVSFADQDDIWLSHKLLRAHEVLEKTGADGYSGDVIAFWPNGRKLLIQKSQKQQKWDFLFESPGPGCTFVLTRHLALECQSKVRVSFTELASVAFHDWFIYALARAGNHRWVIDPQPHMLYRQHSGNQIGANSGLRSWLLRVARISSGWGFTQACLIARLAGLESHPFVAPWISGQRLGLVRLAFHCHQCRRKTADRILFLVSCLWMALCLPGRERLH